MSSDNKSHNLRIDELLLRDHLVTESQIKDALAAQREHGGKIGSHLLRMGHVDEAGILNALANQINCEPVLLSELDIDPAITQMIPANIAIARNIVPFGFDTGSNTLKIACEDPNDLSLINELDFISGEKNIKLYIAVEMSLKVAIAKHYITEMRNSISSRIPFGGEEEENLHSETGSINIEDAAGSVLIVSDEPDVDRPLRAALRHENFRILKADTADDAILFIGKEKLHTVFIKDTVQGDYIDLIDRIRRTSPSTVVRYYDSPGSILLAPDLTPMIGAMSINNLELFTSVLSSKQNLPVNHAGRVGRYVEKLAKKIGIPERDRLMIVTAAYLHDMGRLYYGETKDKPTCHSRIPLTVKLLQSLNYPPLIIGILQTMYKNLRGKYTKRLPIEMMGGNLLTIVEAISDLYPLEGKLSIDRFEEIRRHLTKESGKLYLPEFIPVAIEMLEDEVLVEHCSKNKNQILMYANELATMASLVARLRDDGFRPVALDSLSRFLELYNRSEPDILILVEPGRPAQAIGLVDELLRRGVQIIKIPTYLVASNEALPELTSMFEKGLEDIVPYNSSADLLSVKLEKLRKRISSRATEMNSKGAETSGNLSDMNLIDLLQALGPSGKTAQLIISSGSEQLSIYLNSGQIIYAQSDDAIGPEAVYHAMNWVEGKWVVHPVTKEELPEPNNNIPNEAILMEGCRLLDETTRATKV